MKSDRGLFPWWVARLLFSWGAMAIVSYVLQLTLGSTSPYSWILILVGLVFIAAFTRGPWDSETGGRNRSVLGFQARPGPDQDR